MKTGQDFAGTQQLACQAGNLYSVKRYHSALPSHYEYISNEIVVGKRQGEGDRPNASGGAAKR